MSKFYFPAHKFKALVLLLLPVLLVACGGAGTQQPDPAGSGLISGQLIMPPAGFGITQGLQSQSSQPSGPAPIVPGEVLVGFEKRFELSAASLKTLSASGVQLTLQGGRDVAGYYRYAAPGLDEEQTRALIAELNDRDGIVEAIPNWILEAFRMPDDPFAYLQWHYPRMNLPAAWDIETGHSNRITVAIVDSGGIPDPNLHPDLTFVGGYNFVTGPHGGPVAGRSADFLDYSHMHPEHAAGGGSGFHGLHVAGTIGATTNNGIGLAGVNWAADLVAVRAMDHSGSGSTDDIYSGAWWAAGGSVPGVPENTNPARVVNMSLGGDIGQPCPQFIADMFSTMAANGIITVVAAGNDNMNTATILPANCPGVITVGATDDTDGRAPYSNYGAEIDVMAPGGNMNNGFTDTTTGDVYPAGVLSTILYTPGPTSQLQPSSTFMHGTSMAAPHVAGVVSLMLARNPSLTFDQVLSQLRGASRPLTAAQCGVPDPSHCGSGSVDAAAALGGSPNPPGPNPPAPNPPVPNPPVPNPPAPNPPAPNPPAPNPPAPNPPAPNPPAPNPPGPNPPQPGPVDPGTPVPAGNVYVAALFTNPDGTFDLARSAESVLPVSSGAQVNYTLSSLAAGSYTVAAWQPLTDSGVISAGDPFVMHPQLVTLAAGQQVYNLDLHLQPYSGNSAAAAQAIAELFLLE